MNDAENLFQYYQQLYTQAPAQAQAWYDHPERAAELAPLQERIAALVAGRAVLELGCGSGFWTAQLAAHAASVLALDVSAAALELARARAIPGVQFVQADAAALPAGLALAPAPVVFGGLLWPHVPRQQQEEWLAQVRARAGRDAQLVLLGESYVEGVSASIARTDAHGNTCQIHGLPDGSRHEVIYNFPSDSALRKKLAPALRDLRVERSAHFWLLTGRFK